MNDIENEKEVKSDNNQQYKKRPKKTHKNPDKIPQIFNNPLHQLNQTAELIADPNELQIGNALEKDAESRTNGIGHPQILVAVAVSEHEVHRDVPQLAQRTKHVEVLPDVAELLLRARGK